MELIVICSILFVCFALVVFVFAQEAKVAKKDTNPFSNYKGFNFSSNLKVNGYTFAVDKDKNKLLILKPYATTPINKERELILDFSDIVGIEVNKDGESVTKASIGVPIIGGLLFGAGGLLVGSIIGQRKTKQKLKIDLLLQLNSFENPIVKIPIVAVNDFEIVKEQNLKEFEKLCVWFQLILEHNNKQTV